MTVVASSSFSIAVLDAKLSCLCLTDGKKFDHSLRLLGKSSCLVVPSSFMTSGTLDGGDGAIPYNE